MKQKRKVKSLLSLKKNKKELFLMNLLLILSVSLCIGSALLITTSVGATADDTNICPNDICSYTGLDDKSEVLYRMDFVDPENLEKTVNSMYIKDANFYITSGPVIVNPATADETDIDRNVNKVGTGVYSHILGGSGNEVYSDNITIIAGENNKISSGNDNATILGGKNNNLSGGTPQGTPIISLGGENNKAEKDHDGVALIGGEGNEIGEAVSNTFILGGKNNKVSDTENVIVGGSDVTISGTKNIFVYSNSGNFEPKTDNAFYLNVIGGVGINGTGSVGGMAAENAVSIGNIDISKSCNEDNLGVVGSYQGCLVGCTQKGKDDGNKWELLDRGSGCIDICANNNTKCIAGNNIAETVIPTTNYDAQCTTGYVDITNAHLCHGLSTGSYRNVIFETNLVDSDDPCPFKQENQCVYQCNPGFHLTGDVVSDIVKCYRDCEYNWADAEKQILKHNEVVVGYNTGQVYCSNDAFSFPSNQSPETCANNNHKWNLVCKDGTMYLATKSDGKVANTGKNASANGYIFRNCEVGEYKCNTSVYNLNRNYILGTGKDTITSRNTSDRKNTNGTRGVYKLCLDYNPESGVNNKCNIINGKASDGGYTEHYKLIKCQDHYSTGTDNNIYECKQDCTLTSLTGLTVYYKHNKSATGYVSTGATCTGSCQATALVCNDGKWRLGSKNGPENTGFLYNDCTLHPKKCDASIYNVTGATYLERSGTSIYESCESYNPNGKFQCDYSDTTYHLIDCKEGYHTDNGKWCISNKQPINCNEIGKYKPEEHSAWIASTCEILKDNNEICEILKVWKGTRKTGDYTTYEPDPYCEWDCVGSYHKNSDKTKCISNSCGGTPPQGTEVIKGSNTPSTNGKEWVYTGSTNPGTCEWTCKIGYTRAQGASGNRLNYCVEKQCGDGLPASMAGVLTGKSTYIGEDGKEWTYTDNTNLGTCEWTCDLSNNYHYNSTTEICERKTDWCNNEVLWGCFSPATGTNTGYDGGEYTWDCEINGVTVESGCTYVEENQCKSTLSWSKPLPAEDSTKYKFIKMNGIYDPSYVGYDQWEYVEPDEWDIAVEGSSGKGTCLWTCKDGYTVNENKTKCVIKSVCNMANKSNMRDKQVFCNVGTASNIKLMWEDMGGGDYAPHRSFDCTVNGQTEHCGKYPQFVSIYGPVNIGSYIMDRIEYRGVSSSKISSGIWYFYNRQADYSHSGCAYPPGGSKPRGAADFPHNIQKAIGVNTTDYTIVPYFTGNLEICGRKKSHLPEGWQISELDYLVIPDGDSDIGLIMAGQGPGS